MKKILFILFISISTLCFSQQKNKSDLSSYRQGKTIISLTAYPNPLTTKTQISFNINKNQNVIVKVKNFLGKTVFKKEYKAIKGKNTIPFYKDNLESAMYIYSVQTNSEIISKRLVIK